MESATIAVVDDEPELLDLVGTLLEEEGYAVLCLDHPAQAQRLMEATNQPELLVLDLMLPSMTGIELARILRNDGFPDTPMIAISASTSMLRQAKDSQLFQETLPKPFELDQFLGVVKLHLHSHSRLGGHPIRGQ